MEQYFIMTQTIMYHFAWADQRPVQGNIYIAREGGFFDPHFDL